MKPLRVLVACEFSGVVRDAFRRRGHDAWSCDLLPTEGDPQWHWQEDVLKVMKRERFDLMVAHPPCTYLANSGVRWLHNAPFRGSTTVTHNASRWEAMHRACAFFKMLLSAPITAVAVENPIPHCYARELISPYAQIIQPWQFGHGETKATCLWLLGLPPLKPTCVVEGRVPRVHHASPGPDRWKKRSRTFRGIAEAMAQQWGDVLSEVTP